jgi:hypothetical protein
VRPRGVNYDPIPSDRRLLRAVRRAQEHAAHAKILEQITRETGGNVAEERKRFASTAADSATLRGLPAIGRGVSGAVRGTIPGSNL